MGTINASAGTQVLIDKCGVDVIVDFGVVGGLTEEMKVQKVVVIDRIVKKEGIETVEDLLLSYEESEGARGDDYGIPESGNGIPDILDECRYETEWLLKMQNLNTGAVYSAVTVAEGQEATVSYVEPSSNNASLVMTSSWSRRTI